MNPRFDIKKSQQKTAIFNQESNYLFEYFSIVSNKQCKNQKFPHNLKPEFECFFSYVSNSLLAIFS